MSDIDPTTLGSMFTALGTALTYMLPPSEKKKTGATRCESSTSSHLEKKLDDRVKCREPPRS